MSAKNHSVTDPLLKPLDRISDLTREPIIPEDWRIWDLELPDFAGTIRAAYFHVPTQQLWVDPNICGGLEGVSMALHEQVAIEMVESNRLPLVLAPAGWTRTKFPLNSGWVTMCQDKFREAYPTTHHDES